jgi:uncharacterized short protein YbdD (DUF466 family)
MSNEGLMILTGANSTSISDIIAGESDSPLVGVNDYDRIVDNPNTYQPDEFINDDTPFAIYAENARIAFTIVALLNGEIEKEIIVSNTDYDYSYVYSIISKTWHKITQSWDRFLHDYPKTYGTKQIDSDYFLDDLSAEQKETDQEILVHLETRPIKFGEDLSYKKIIRTLLYGFLNPVKEKPFTFYLFGTVDDEHWFSQQASNIVTPGDKAILGRTLFSCKKFIIVMGGYVYDNTFISGLISDVEKRYTNKLR